MSRSIWSARAPDSGCATWAEAEDEAEADVRPWVTQMPAGQHTVEVSARVLADIADAAESVSAAHAEDGAPCWKLVGADLTEVAALCRTPPGKLPDSSQPAVSEDGQAR